MSLKAEDLKILRSYSKIGNMLKEKFVVPKEVIYLILTNFTLTEEAQKTAVNKLVDRKPNWTKLSEEEQLEEIKAILTLQTVAEYLYTNGLIHESCEMFENGFDKNGNVVLDAMYLEETEQTEKINELFIKKEQAKKNNNVVPFVKIKKD